ncbi:HisJ family histidinol phosphate phosphatase [Clostridium sartagoforme AAU1]|uniref:Histidinol-phosphatase n=1 Tax=Clostridium sartagoforme AAU1 TaxID=1202534 RepID=R9BTX2_9CLOT|nr:histidinol-phosphatase HisJ family protein [Clostridium sartagoforme]EOR20452.1 HisJ family histidinol phosphate phosphatase [Clostridium sartagoforme AAU1]
MITDYHIHTEYSIDSTYPMEDIIIQAINLGIDEICFTEHMDYFINDFTHLVNYDEYLKEYNFLKDKYKDRVNIKLGSEFGVQMHTIKEFQRDFNKYDFDFIILSNHQVDDKEFWNGEFQKGKNQLEYNNQYYKAILNVISNYKDYSVLGHLDMIKRYDSKGILDDKFNEDIIKEILRMVIKDEKGIEVNTSCFRYGLPDITPSRTILKWYYELGGKVITIGSDTHKESDLGYKIEEVKDILKDIGFKEFCTFNKMKAIYHDL